MSSALTGPGSSSYGSSACRPVAGGASATVLRWLGHSCILLTTASGTKILMDPIPKSYGYDGPPLEGVDAITITHEHQDHANIEMASGGPAVFRGLSGGDCTKIDEKVKGVGLRTVATAHDDVQGAQRGKNAVFIFEADGMRIAHLGDLGHVLSAEQVSAIKPVDILLAPVGGSYTIDPGQATRVVEQLGPRVIIPIHFKMPYLRPDWPGVGVEAFLSGKKVQKAGGPSYSITKETLPSESTVVLLTLD